jgi:hypothetical protein
MGIQYLKCVFIIRDIIPYKIWIDNSIVITAAMETNQEPRLLKIKCSNSLLQSYSSIGKPSKEVMNLFDINNYKNLLEEKE